MQAGCSHTFWHSPFWASCKGLRPAFASEAGSWFQMPKRLVVLESGLSLIMLGASQAPFDSPSHLGAKQVIFQHAFRAATLRRLPADSFAGVADQKRGQLFMPPASVRHV